MLNCDGTRPLGAQLSGGSLHRTALVGTGIPCWRLPPRIILESAQVKVSGLFHECNVGSPTVKLEHPPNFLIYLGSVSLTSSRDIHPHRVSHQGDFMLYLRKLALPAS